MATRLYVRSLDHSSHDAESVGCKGPNFQSGKVWHSFRPEFCRSQVAVLVPEALLMRCFGFQRHAPEQPKPRFFVAPLLKTDSAERELNASRPTCNGYLAGYALLPSDRLLGIMRIVRSGMASVTVVGPSCLTNPKHRVITDYGSHTWNRKSYGAIFLM